MTISTIPAPMRLGPYELLRRLATGGMAEVYLARRAGPHGFQKLVALKRILPQFARDADFVAMFVDEARVCARLGHPNIVQVFDFGEQDGELYMAMEYVDGSTGARLVRAAAGQGDELPLDVCLHITLSILRALEYAHAARDDEGKPLALVHRDVSPGNVLIDRTGAVKLTDFGIARAAEIERRTDAGQLKGKLGYMSPEQVVGRELDARSDLFTLGIVLAEMLILRPLFSGGKELDVLLRIRDADLGAIDRATGRVPDDVRSVLFRALARDPAMRWSSAAAFAEALEEIVRRRRLQVGPSRLASVIEKLGLVSGGEPDDDSGELAALSTAPIECDTSTRRVLREEEEGAARSKPVAPEIYRVQRPDGTITDPMPLPHLIELFATGQVVGTDTGIAVESGRFKPAAEIPELARFITSPALKWDADFPTEAIDRGKLDPTRLPTRLFHLAVRRETGVLVLRDGARRKRIFFVEGSPECVTSTDKQELLGEFLVRRGQVLRMEVEMALAMLPRFGGRLGDALVGLGVLRPIELFRAIHDQTQHRLMEVLRWKTGEIAFARGVRSQEETFPLGVDLYELLGRAIREGYSYDELDATLAPLQEEVIERVAVPPVRLEMFRLPEAESACIEAMTGKTTLGKMVAHMTRDGIADPEDVLRAVFLGLACELLRSPKWVVPPSFVKGGVVKLSVRAKLSLLSLSLIAALAVVGDAYLGSTLSTSIGEVVPTELRAQAVDRARADARRFVWGGSLLALALALLVSHVVARRISSSVGALTEVARRLTEGDLAARARLDGDDEMGDLGLALDRLAGSLVTTLGELRAQRDLQGRILETMQEGVVVVDREGHIVLVNSALRAMLLVGAEAVGKLLIEAVRHAELDELLEEAREAHSAGPTEIELPGLKPRRLLVHASPLSGDDERVLVVFVDVTELRRLESLRREFVANASHELRTPIAAVRSATETLQHGALDDGKAATRFVDIIERNAQRLQSLVEDMLDLSKLESNEFRLKRERVELSGVVPIVLGLFRERADKKGVRLVSELPALAPAIQGDPRGLEHVLSNLVDNAVKYCPAGSTIVVRATQDGDKVRLVVSDTGPGIPAEHLPRVFERFYRVDAGRSRELGGTGLGLSIVKHMVEAMRGAVSVESTVGKGSTFTVSLAASERLNERHEQFTHDADERHGGGAVSTR